MLVVFFFSSVLLFGCYVIVANYVSNGYSTKASVGETMFIGKYSRLRMPLIRS